MDRTTQYRSIYYVCPSRIGKTENWNALCQRCRELGFDHLALPPPFMPGPAGDLFLPGNLLSAHPSLYRSLGVTADDKTETEALVARLAAICKDHGLGLLFDIVLDRADASGTFARSNPDIFASARPDLPDPRRMSPARHIAYLRQDASKRALALWSDCLQGLLRAGASGFRFVYPAAMPAPFWRMLNDILRHGFPDAISLAFTPGMNWQAIEALAAAEFDGVFSSLPWWDRRAGWYAAELDLLRRVAPVIACPEVPFGGRLIARLDPAADIGSAYRQALDLAAATGDALMVPGGYEVAERIELDPRPALDTSERPEAHAEAYASYIDLASDIRRANERIARLAKMRISGATYPLTVPSNPIAALIRHDAFVARAVANALVVAVNPDLQAPHELDLAIDPMEAVASAPLGTPRRIDGEEAVSAPLAPGEVRLLHVERLTAVVQEPADTQETVLNALEDARIIIASIEPIVDGGRFAAKSLCGEKITVSADIFTDGHGVIAAELLWRAADQSEWQRVPMQADKNDRWQADFASGRIGRHWFTIEAWIDEFASQCRDLVLKKEAGADVALEIEEACALIAAAANNASGAAKSFLDDVQNRARAADQTAAVQLIAGETTRATMRQAGRHAFSTWYEKEIPIEIERPQAGFGAWYELFPRSLSPLPERHGTFDDVIARLPAIRTMGFDVLYLPPIHPIGHTNRKGRNNSLTAEPNDPGSPYAIGDETGGHDALHPQLGSFDDFRRLVAAAAENGIEIALDFAIQCSPDHPWLKQHPNWFRWRNDGSLRFAENPPKKYEDIVNVDFYADDGAPDLWLALRDVVLFWIAHGIRIFRVDNPHTKPLPFWQWLIGTVRAAHPDTIFLSEAFTRPKMTYHLAKIGFSQSYTYFTWRNTKRELTDYLTELATEPVVSFFRPHFFVNTPDINPFFLQQSGRPGFLIRAALAATLSGLWGMYSGFELCESAPLPGREEYLDSEKYEIRHRDYTASGNINAEIAKLNQIRRENPALRSHRGLRFYNAYNDTILLYGKTTSKQRDMVLVAVSLDPHQVQEANIEVPLWEWGIADDGPIGAEDLIRGTKTVWTGKLQHLRIDPADLPYAIWRIAPLGGLHR